VAGFTPGPWETSLPFDKVKSADETGITTIAICLGRQQTRKMNAHLIAAAPEMHVALKAITAAITSEPIRTAINALGELNYHALDEAIWKAEDALAKAEGGQK